MPPLMWQTLFSQFSGGHPDQAIAEGSEAKLVVCVYPNLAGGSTAAVGG